MNKKEIDSRVQRLQRLVQQAQASEAESAGRLSLCLRAVDDAEAKLRSLIDYRAPERLGNAAQDPGILNNDRQFMSSVNRAKDAQAGVVNQYQRQAIAAETNWHSNRRKLDVLMRALAAIQTLQRQEVARKAQDLSDDLVSQSVLMRPGR